jgi:hypothetical protein
MRPIGSLHGLSVLAPLLLLGALAACGPEGSLTSPGGQGVEVAVAPPTAKLATGAPLAFAAAVTGTVDTSVTWEVVEPGGGTVDAAGTYRAPAVAGIYHVRARSKADPAAHGEATVAVAAPVVVTVTPKTASVVAGGRVSFGATVSGTTNTAVAWSVVEANCGSITTAGVYSAPPAAATCHVVAASSAEPGKTDTATLTVTAPPIVTVAVSPATSQLDACRSLTLAATLTGTNNVAATWSVAEGAAGGSITPGGVYTAPSVAGTYHAVATSQADPSKSASASIVVVERVLAVAVAPGTVSVQPGGSAVFTATVTTTCGSFTATQTAPVAGALSAN